MSLKKRSPELAQLAGKLYLELNSGIAVAKRLSVGVTTAYRLLAASGVQVAERWSEAVSSRRRKLQGETALAAINDYKTGLPVAVIKKKYGTGDHAIRSAVRASGVPLRKTGGRNRVVLMSEEEDIVRLYTVENWSQNQIAVKLGCHQTLVSSILRKRGITKRKNRGEEHGSWQGGKSMDGYGYILQLLSFDDEMASMTNRSGYVRQHRLVMARQLGRPLHRKESVHHINGDKTDNRPENLQLRHGSHGNGVVLKCGCCGSKNIVPETL